MDGLLSLSPVDLKFLEAGNLSDLDLSNEEQRALRLLKDYEDKARQQRMYGDEDRDIEGKRGDGSDSSETREGEDILIFGYSINVERYGTLILVTVFSAIVMAFYWCMI